MGRRAITGKVDGFYHIMGVPGCSLPCVGLEPFQVEMLSCYSAFVPKVQEHAVIKNHPRNSTA